MRVLFVTWDSGQVDYLASLFFPVFAALQEHGIQVQTLQGTWGDDAAVARSTAAAADHGLVYRALRFSPHHRRARMPVYMAQFARALAQEVREHNIDVVMPRAIIPAGVTLLAMPWLRHQRILWDADGLPADERVDFAGWGQRDPRYLAMRGVERAMLHQAHAVMVRTAHAQEILKARAGNQAPLIRVVPNGRDAALYKPSPSDRASVRSAHNIPQHAPVVISVGSLGPQYFPAQQADIVAALLQHDPQAHAVFLTAQHAQILQLLRDRGVDVRRVIAQRVPAAEVPRWLAAADVGLALRQASFSQRAVCPLKVGEYLLSGLPVIATTGVGDLDQQLADDLSLLIPDIHAMNPQHVAEWICGNAPASLRVQERCRAIGLAYFSLEAAVRGYQQLLLSSLTR